MSPTVSRARSSDTERRGASSPRLARDHTDTRGRRRELRRQQPPASAPSAWYRSQPGESRPASSRGSVGPAVDRAHRYASRGARGFSAPGERGRLHHPAHQTPFLDAAFPIRCPGFVLRRARWNRYTRAEEPVAGARACENAAVPSSSATTVDADAVARAVVEPSITKVRPTGAHPDWAPPPQAVGEQRKNCAPVRAFGNRARRSAIWPEHEGKRSAFSSLGARSASRGVMSVVPSS